VRHASPMKMLRIRSCRKSRQYLYKWKDNKSKWFKQKKRCICEFYSSQVKIMLWQEVLDEQLFHDPLVWLLEPLKWPSSPKQLPIFVIYMSREISVFCSSSWLWSTCIDCLWFWNMSTVCFAVWHSLHYIAKLGNGENNCFWNVQNDFV